MMLSMCGFPFRAEIFSSLPEGAVWRYLLKRIFKLIPNSYFRQDSVASGSLSVNNNKIESFFSNLICKLNLSGGEHVSCANWSKDDLDSFNVRVQKFGCSNNDEQNHHNDLESTLCYFQTCYYFAPLSSL